jgi:hypothetical protein
MGSDAILDPLPKMVLKFILKIFKIFYHHKNGNFTFFIIIYGKVENF